MLLLTYETFGRDVPRSKHPYRGHEIVSVLFKIDMLRSVHHGVILRKLGIGNFEISVCTR